MEEFEIYSLGVGIGFLFLLSFLIFEIIFFSLAVFILVSGFISDSKGAPYVPLPRKSIRRILEFAEIENSLDIYDLGCGDGRILIEAVKNLGIKKGVGYEISPWPYLKANFLIKRQGLSDKIKIFRQDFFEADLSKADTVFIYLYPKLVQKLAFKFDKELKKGARVICVSFPVDEPEKFNLELIKTAKIDKFNVFIYQKI